MATGYIVLKKTWGSEEQKACTNPTISYYRQELGRKCTSDTFTLWPNEATVFDSRGDALAATIRMYQLSKGLTARGREPVWEYEIMRVKVREYAEA